MRYFNVVEAGKLLRIVEYTIQMEIIVERLNDSQMHKREKNISNYF
jgi:hypothetical protein